MRTNMLNFLREIVLAPTSIKLDLSPAIPASITSRPILNCISIFLDPRLVQEQPTIFMVISIILIFFTLKVFILPYSYELRLQMKAWPGFD